MPRPRALLPRLLVALLLASTLPAGRAGAGELTAEEQRFTKDMLVALAANSPHVRKSAEESIARMGVDALPVIAEGLPQLKSEAALKGLRRALEGMGRADVLAALGRLAQGATSRAVAKRYEDVATLLGGGAAGDVPNSVPLQPVPLEDWTLAPLALEARVRDRLPPGLVSGTYLVREEAGTLRVDADGDGVEEAVIPAGPGRLVEVGPAGHKTTLLVYAKGAAWYACPTALLRGGTGSSAVEFLDADGDGAFDGPGDFVRIADGAFGRLGPEKRVRLEDGVYTGSVVHEATGWRLALVREPPPAGFDEPAWTGLAAIDRWRRTLGLPPVRLDAARCDGCKKHALYLQRNAGSPETASLGAHHELEGKPGYTTEGKAAGANGIIASNGDPERAVASFAATMLHATPLLGAPKEGFGVGCAAGRGGATVIWGDDPDLREARAPLVIPAPGQRRVPLRGGAEDPPPDLPPAWYAAPRGFPVSVYTAGMGLSHVEVRLFTADGKTPVPAHGWSDEAQIRKGYGNGVAFLMPDAPLEPKQAYLAVVSAKRGDGDVSWTWSFRTD